MRYYKLEIINQSGVVQNTYTSYPDNVTDLGALNIEFDVNIYPGANPIGATSIKLWGIPLYTIGHASNFNGLTLKLSAGFQKGLPLATLAFESGHTGLILQGTILQAFGNWIETNQWLEFVVIAGVANTTPNLTFNCPKGTQYSAAILNTLQTAYPTYSTPTINISSSLVPGEDIHHVPASFTEFAQFLESDSKAIITASTYAGVQIISQGNSFNVYDGTASTPSSSILVLAYTDLIGQPAYLAPDEIQVIVSMRNDINPGDVITIPPTIVTTTPSQNTIPIGSVSWSGNFYVKSVRHVGNLRQPSALAWITVLDCAAQSVLSS